MNRNEFIVRMVLCVVAGPLSVAAADVARTPSEILCAVNDRLEREFISHDGLMLDYVGEIPTAEEIADLKPNAMGWNSPISNGSMFTGEWLPALMGEGVARKALVEKCVRGLIRMSEVSDVPGCIARGTGTDGKSHYPWGSNDQTDPWFLGLCEYCRWPHADPALKAKALERLVSVARALEKNGWGVPCDGQFKGKNCGNLNSKGMPFWGKSRFMYSLKSLHRLTGDAHWSTVYESIKAQALDEIEAGGEVDAKVFTGTYGWGVWIYLSSVQALARLIEMEENPNDRARMRKGLLRYAERVAPLMRDRAKYANTTERPFKFANWRTGYAWRVQKTRKDAGEVAASGKREILGTRKDYERLGMSVPLCAAAICALSGEAKYQGEILATLRHYDYSTPNISEFFHAAVAAKEELRCAGNPDGKPSVCCAEASVRAADMTVESARATMAKAIRSVYDLELTPPAVNVDPGPEFSRTNMTFAMNAGMAMTSGGRLWSVWHAGEDGPKAHLVGTWSDDDGRTWQETRMALCSAKPLFVCAAGCDWFEEDRMRIHLSCIVANIWMAPDGTLRLYALVAVNGFDGRGALCEYICRNPDATKPTWNTGKRIGWGGAHSKPQVLSDGTWIVPNDFESIEEKNFPELDPLRGCGFLASSDGGKTWTRRGYVKPKGTNHYAEHQVVELADRSLLMYLRTGLGMMESRSRDGGRTWTQPVLPESLRQIVSRFVFQRLPNGHVLVVKNGNGPMLVTDGDWWGQRRELTAFVSDDEGRTWKGGLVLDPRARVAYPDAFVSKNGFVYVSYDHDRMTGVAEILFAKFTEADVLAGRLVNEGSRLRNVVFSSKRD